MPTIETMRRDLLRYGYFIIAHGHGQYSERRFGATMFSAIGVERLWRGVKERI